ncbi:MAG TPA: PfkB family carbohydrate kinase [Vicinamibacterales bacterium]|nr:PfkB family carbohydrate kinase [Vicinamibacterales bacterium]
MSEPRLVSPIRPSPDPASSAERWRQKIVPLADLARVRSQFRDRTIVLCHGAFDLVHVGHMIHFEEARAVGNLLVVTLTSDKHISKKRSLSMREDYRARQVASLEIVDYVAIVDEPSAVAALEVLQPDVYVKGPEYSDLLLDKTSNISHEKTLVERYGGRIHFTSGETFSSTKLSHFLLSSTEASQENPLLRNDRVMFRDLSSRGFKLEEIKSFLVGASRLRVCLLGETITDEWVDVSVENISQKSRCVAGLETGRIRQIGGAGIVALHLAGFVKSVHCFTNGLKAADVPPNVTVTPLADMPLVKTRFVDENTGYPLFEAKQLALEGVRRDQIPNFDDYDLVLLADFGHGLLDAAQINRRIARERRAAVAAMVQVNSSNYGYNLPTKYAGADYYSINRAEAELSLHEQGHALPVLVDKMSALLGCEELSVTDGANGVMVRIRDERYALPTLSTSVVDTIGCGDAYFALSSLAACLELAPRMVALAGSIGAAAMAQRRCNERPISDQEFLTIAKIVI